MAASAAFPGLFFCFAATVLLIIVCIFSRNHTPYLTTLYARYQYHLQHGKQYHSSTSQTAQRQPTLVYSVTPDLRLPSATPFLFLDLAFTTRDSIRVFSTISPLSLYSTQLVSRTCSYQVTESLTPIPSVHSRRLSGPLGPLWPLRRLLPPRRHSHHVPPLRTRDSLDPHRLGLLHDPLRYRTQPHTRPSFACKLRERELDRDWRTSSAVDWVLHGRVWRVWSLSQA